MKQALYFNGVNQYMTAPSMPHTRIEMDCVLFPEARSVYMANANYNFIGRNNTNTAEQVSGVRAYIDGTDVSTGLDLVPFGKRTTVVVERADGQPYTSILYFLRNTMNERFCEGYILGIKIYNGEALAAEYNPSLGHVLDISGNGRHATLYGAPPPWVVADKFGALGESALEEFGPLLMDGSNDNVVVAIGTPHDEIILDFELEDNEVSGNIGTIFSGTVGRTSINYQLFSLIELNDVPITSGFTVPYGQRTVMRLVGKKTETTVLAFFSQFGGWNPSKGKLYAFTVKLAGETVLHIDFTSGRTRSLAGTVQATVNGSPRWVKPTYVPLLAAFDNFKRANAETLGKAPTGQTWEAVDESAILGITDGRGYLIENRFNAATNPFRILDAGISDGRVILTGSTTTGSAGLARMMLLFFRVVDRWNYFFIENINVQNTWVLKRKIGNVIVILHTVTDIPNTTSAIPTAIEIVLDGPLISWYMNGRHIVDIEDDTHMTATKYGLSTERILSRFDLFAIEALASEENDVTVTVKELTGTAASVSTSEGRMKRMRTFLATSFSEPTTRAKLTRKRPLVGLPVKVASTASGRLRKRVNMSGTTSAAPSIADAKLRTVTRFTGASTSASRTSASTKSRRSLNGSPYRTHTTASGTLKAQAMMRGTSVSTSIAVAGGLDGGRTVYMSGESQARSAASGVLKAKANLSRGTSVSVSHAEGAFIGKQVTRLTASVAVASHANGTLKAAVRMSGSASSTTHAEGVLDDKAQVRMTAIVVVRSDASGALRKRTRLNAQAAGASITQPATAKRRRRVQGSSTSYSHATAYNGKVSELRAITETDSYAEGKAHFRRRMTALVDVSSDASGSMSMHTRLYAYSVADVFTTYSILYVHKGLKAHEQPHSTTCARLSRDFYIRGYSTSMWTEFSGDLRLFTANIHETIYLQGGKRSMIKLKGGV